MLAAGASAALGQASGDEARLRRYLERFPEADADKDGVLTMEEVRAHRAKRQAGGPKAQRQQPGTRQPPTHADVRYREHPSNVLDVYLAKSAKPAPLVIFIHGGGFRGGDKRGVDAYIVQQCHAAGISVASINYRMLPEFRFPVPMYDSARAVQFLRSKARKWNLDPKRFAAMGGSAGAGISLWLAFHDDLADANSADPIARQSTRLTCAAVAGAQTSYDWRFCEEIGLGGIKKHPVALPLYGFKAWPETWPAEADRIAREVSPINHVTKDDVPVLLTYGTPAGAEGVKRDAVHHPKFGLALKERMDKLGIECIVLYPNNPDPNFRTGRIRAIDFIKRHFGMAGPSRPSAPPRGKAGKGQ
jgi:hypothetical protein